MTTDSVELMDPVEYVFSRMAATYGAAWDKSLGQAPIVDVKTVWADALSGYLHSDEAKKSIMWALKNLPDRCINSREFRTLCGHSPARVTLALTEPVANPARVSAELAKLGHVRSAKQSVVNGMKDWANRLKSRHDAGQKLNLNQVRCYRDALGLNSPATAAA